MKKHAYIDESGDECLDLQQGNASSFYVVCALVVDPAHLDQVIQRFQEVRNRYFKNREMKSSGISSDVLRQAIVQDLTGVPYSLHVLVGNKKLITSPGLRYPKSFIKHLHGFLYKEVLKDYSGVHIRADQVKNRAFMDEMSTYLTKNNLFGLFDMNSFEFVDSKSDVCIQVADFIGGSIRACFERNPQTPFTDPTMQKLNWHINQIHTYPDSYRRYIAKIPGVGEFDQKIESRAVLEAEEFLRKHRADEELDRELQVEAVRSLLLALAKGDNWVPTGSLMERLNVIAPEPLSEQSFRGVIGKLRDAGLLIASKTTGGYKLPTSMADMIEFVNRQNSQLTPMIHRVQVAQQTVRRATDNAVDILAAPEFQNLRAAVMAASGWSPADMQVGSPEASVESPARPLMARTLPVGLLVGASHA